MNWNLYLARIGLSAAPAPDPAGLQRLQWAHRTAIGFENLDILLGRRIEIDPQSVFDKLVVRQRGGYCFEQNRLFSDALQHFGWTNRPLLARVYLGLATGVVPPRTHTLLLVDMGQDGEWIADAGFGGAYVPPLKLEDGFEAGSADGARHRIRRSGPDLAPDGEWTVERVGSGESTDGRGGDAPGWQVQYAFDTAKVWPDDLEMSNHWTSTRPGSRFVTTHVASAVLEDGFAALTDRRLKLYSAGRTQIRDIASAAEYAEVLAETFGINLSLDEAAVLPLYR